MWFAVLLSLEWLHTILQSLILVDLSKELEVSNCFCVRIRRPTVSEKNRKESSFDTAHVRRIVSLFVVCSGSSVYFFIAIRKVSNQILLQILCYMCIWLRCKRLSSCETLSLTDFRKCDHHKSQRSSNESHGCQSKINGPLFSLHLVRKLHSRNNKTKWIWIDFLRQAMMWMCTVSKYRSSSRLVHYSS